MMRVPTVQERARIIELNDRLRTTFTGGRVQLHVGTHCLDAQIRGRALYALSRYNRFTPDDAHDFGCFTFAGFQFEWRIDYRGADGRARSQNPADPNGTLRILTLYVVRDILP
jgi:hypothetical protein